MAEGATSVKVLLLTGAGASVNLGKGEGALPLLPGLMERIGAVLDGISPGLPAAFGFPEAGADAIEVETAFSRLTKWVEAVPVVRDVVLGSSDLKQNTVPATRIWLANHAQLAADVGAAFNGAVYEMYGAGAVDVDKARSAYEALFSVLPEPLTLTIATTNYDPSAYLAASELFDKVQDGFEPLTTGSTPVLDAERIKARVNQRDPLVLHLHGAVAWYRREEDEEITKGYLDAQFDGRAGIPVFLPPDPEKNFLNDARVTSIWLAFRAAVKEADLIVILGHNLNDRPIVNDLTEDAPDTPTIMLSRTPGAKVERLLTKGGRNVHGVSFEFGPDIDQGQLEELRQMIERLLVEGS